MVKSSAPANAQKARMEKHSALSINLCSDRHGRHVLSRLYGTSRHRACVEMLRRTPKNH
jgi:hypothetical protein